MEYVVDIQGFFDKDGCFIAKEVAVIALKKSYFAHWITAPTQVFSELPKSVRSKNNWATLHHHGLEWFEGDVPLRTLHANLRQVTRGAEKIYVRGLEKAKYLQNIISREVRNLEEDSSCPSFAALPSSPLVCLHHALLKRPNLSCALHNAACLKEWILRDVIEYPLTLPSLRFLPEPVELEKRQYCFSPVLSRDECDLDITGGAVHTIESDEYDPDSPGIAGYKLETLDKCTRS